MWMARHRWWVLGAGAVLLVPAIMKVMGEGELAAAGVPAADSA
jgi:hypothetical protein